MRYFICLIILIPVVTFGQALAEDFDSVEAQKAAEVAPDSLRDELFEAYADAVGNWEALAGFISAYDDEMRADAIWLVNTMPHLDRLLVTEEVLREHLEFAFRVKDEAPWPVPDTMFRAYILAYRISYEPVTPWRKLFFNEFFAEAKSAGNPRDAAKMVNAWIAENIDTADYEFFGGMQSPDLTYRRGKGTKSEISSLLTAILKALGIPSRNAMIRTVRGVRESMTWVEIYDAGSEEWVPVYPKEPEEFGNFGYPGKKHRGGVTVVTVIGGFEMDYVTSDYTRTGYFRAEFSRAGKPADGWEHFSVCALGGGAYWPLDEIGAEADSLGVFEFELGVGEYVLQNGMRDPTGSVWVQTFPFAIYENETTVVEVTVDAPQYLGVSAPSGEFPIFTLNDTDGKPFSHNRIKGKKPIVWFFFDDDAEPSVRALPMIKPIYEEWKDSLRFIAVWVRDNGNPAPDIDIPWRVLIDEDGELTLAMTGLDNLPALKDEKLPLIIFSSGEDYSYEVTSEGYNLDIENLLRNRIDEWRAR